MITKAEQWPSTKPSRVQSRLFGFFIWVLRQNQIAMYLQFLCTCSHKFMSSCHRRRRSFHHHHNLPSIIKPKIYCALLPWMNTYPTTNNEIQPYGILLMWNMLPYITVLMQLFPTLCLVFNCVMFSSVKSFFILSCSSHFVPNGIFICLSSYKMYKPVFFLPGLYF